MNDKSDRLSLQREQEVYAHRVKLLYRGTPLACAASFISIALLTFLNHTVVATGTLALWGGAVAVLTVVRYGLYVAFMRVAPSPDRIRSWANFMIACLFVLGVLWGSSAWLMMPVEPMVHQLYTALAMLGIITGAMSGLYPVMTAFVAFMLPMTLQPIIRLLWIGDGPQLVIAALAIMLVLYMIVFARRNVRVLTDSLTLGYEKEDLVEQLTREVQSSKALNSELERIKGALEKSVNKRTEDLQQEVNDHKSTARKLNTAKEQSDIANRAKSDFLANMSHELRTPLNAIIGFSDSIKHEIYGPLGNEKYKGYIQDIYGSGHHLLELINDILDVSAIEAGKLEIFEEDLDIADVIEATQQLLIGRADSGNIHLTTSTADGLAMLRADRRRLIQILLNVLSNAIKFTRPGGAVTLTAALDAENAHVFTVTDTGVGMNSAELAKAMTEFGQVDRSLARKQEGTGLGLPLTKGLIDLLGGTLKIDSKKSEGTTVTVRFPPERTVGS